MSQVTESVVVRNESGSKVTIHIGRDMDRPTFDRLVANKIVTPVEAAQKGDEKK